MAPFRYFLERYPFAAIQFLFQAMCLGIALIVISDISQVVAWLADDYNRCYNCQHPLTPSQAPDQLRARAGQNACPHCGARRNQLFALRREQVGCLSLIFFFPIIFLPILLIVPLELAYPSHFRYRGFPPNTMEWLYFIGRLILLSIIMGRFIPWLVAWLSDDGYTCYYCQRPFHLKPPADPRAAHRPLYQRSSGLRRVKHCPNCGSRQWFLGVRAAFKGQTIYTRFLPLFCLLPPLIFQLYGGRQPALFFSGGFLLVGFYGIADYLASWLGFPPNTCPRCNYEYDDLVPYEQKKVSLKKKKKR